MRDRGTKNTPADVLSAYGGGAWPLKSVYDRGELASNGNYLEPEKIAVRHGICGDPEQVLRRSLSVGSRITQAVDRATSCYWSSTVELF